MTEPEKVTHLIFDGEAKQKEWEEAVLAAARGFRVSDVRDRLRRVLSPAEVEKRLVEMLGPYNPDGPDMVDPGCIATLIMDLRKEWT